MGNTDRDELQRIADLVETNRERLQNIESQVVRLEEVRQEQARAIMALKAIPASGANDAMIPLGGGVQIIADIPSEGGAVIDIGSGIQAEKTREEALELLSSRNEELIRLMDSLRSEFDETEKLVIELANQFNEGIEELQGEGQDSTDSTTQEPENRSRRRRRKRGTEFTLDD
tara:strand:- start:944 stop:1462 length:519 start_codon:yes stop_codon:yes gene_type:complete